MNDIRYHDCREDICAAGADVLLMKIPLDPATGKAFDRCSYAFIPGCRLCGAEPEIVVKVYDSLLFQHPDTAFIMDRCGGDRLADAWETMGRPVLVTPCMECLSTLRSALSEAETMSLYELLMDMNVSGGCNSIDYTLFESPRAPADDRARDAVIRLAETMGVTFRDDDGKLPYITCCMDERDHLKRQGRDAVHILELVYGMGESNAHMEHEHDHDHDHDHSAPVTSAAPAKTPSPGVPAPHADPAVLLPGDDERIENIRQLAGVMTELFGDRWT